MELKTQISKFLFEHKDDFNKQKVSFWATESESSAFELYHSFKGTPVTNPIDAETKFALGMRKKLEETMVDSFKDLGIYVEPEPFTTTDGIYVEKPDQHRVDMERLGIRISGYMDAIILEEGKKIPVEIKTSYGPYAKRDLDNCMPKLSYLKQLAQYMDYMGAFTGYLVQSHFKESFLIDNIYQFTLVRNGDIFTCGQQSFNLFEDVYKRYKMIWDTYIVLDIEPKSEYRYKYPLDTIDWKSVGSVKISKARNGKAVIGDWQVQYSGYKNLIAEKEGSELGYDDDEIALIKKLTAGFTTWNK